MIFDVPAATVAPKALSKGAAEVNKRVALIKRRRRPALSGRERI